MDHDAMLVNRCLKGEPKAFAELVKRHQGRIITVIYRTVGNRDVALDLAQETFIKAYRALRSYKPSYRFTSWINRIALNTAIDHIRRNKNCHEPYDEATAEANQSLQTIQQDDPLYDLVKLEQNRLIQSALQQLPIAYRVPLLLRFNQELSHVEIADMLGITVNTLKVRLHRGLNRLREILTAMEGIES